MQKIISISTAVLILVCFSTVSSARADRKTMEGFIIGTGVAMLGAAIINGISNNSDKSYAQSHSRHNDRTHYERHTSGQRHKFSRKECRKNKERRARGHWEIEKIWMEPVYETKWNPAHYDRKGRWVTGRYEKFIVAKGFWQEKKVWVRNGLKYR